jgi:hypothetical protein
MTGHEGSVQCAQAIAPAILSQTRQPQHFQYQQGKVRDTQQQERDAREEAEVVRRERQKKEFGEEPVGDTHEQADAPARE